MGYRQDDKYVIYPLYFDASISRKSGRRIPKKLGCEKPTITDLSKVAKNLGFNPLLETDTSHPKKSWRKEGRIRIDKKDSKQSMILRIAKSL
jgi:signal recognition particle subunit SRP19